jgi:DNA-binding IclR family transcriptional regulator
VPRPRTETAPDTPKVLVKTLQVLESFDADNPRWTEAALRRRLDMPSSTLHRMIRGLEQAGYLLRDEAGRYRLGIGAVRLGRRADASLDLPAVLDPELRALAAQTEELVILAVPELSDGAARYIATVDSPQRLRVTAELGTSVPLTAGATAKSLLAFAAPAQIESTLKLPRRRLAAGTVTGLRALREQLGAIAARGWAISWEETYDGAWAVAAPVLDAEGHAFASIGVASPISRHSRGRESSTRQAVITAARHAGHRLGAQAPRAAS